MGKSARIIGWEDFGLNARDMNALLKEHGYLYGEPGAYGLTEKGARYGDEQYNENGYGGFAHRSWETRTWNDDLADALKADIAASAEASEHEDDDDEDDDFVYDPHAEWEPEVSNKALLAVAGAVAAVVAVVIAAPHVKRLWVNKISPGVKSLREKVAERFKREPTESEDALVDEQQADLGKSED